MSVPDLPTDLLRTFVTAAEAGSFTAAARRLGRAQSGVSQQVQRLEQLLGAMLFERGRRIRLTEHGEVLLSYARPILRLAGDAARRLRGASVDGTVRLGVNEHAIDALPPRLGRFARAHPNVRLEVEVGSSTALLERLREGRLELAIANLHGGPDAAANATVLVEEPLVWAGHPDLAPLEEPVLPLVVFSPTCRLRLTAIERLDARERKWRVAVTSSSLSGVRAAAAAGLGVAVLLESTLGPDLRRLGAADGLPDLPAARIALFRSDRTANPAARSLDEFLVADHARPAHRSA